MNQFAAQSSLKPRLRKMALERFRAWKPADGWKYVWNDGFIYKDKKMITRKQRHILTNIIDAFYAQGMRVHGSLVPECEMQTAVGKYRIPDIGFFTNAQNQEKETAAHTFPADVCGFVVEVISETDSGYQIESKIWEYFEAGVQVVWQIFPHINVVKIYTAPNQITVATFQNICSAAPVLPLFQMTVADIFKAF